MDALSIRTFVAVKDTQSFSKAADMLYLTQPAVSKRIAALEGELGSKLFDRIGRKILLTEAGRELYPRAQKILLELDDSRRAIVNLTGKVTGRLSFGTSHHIGLHRLPPVLRNFSETYPDVELGIQFLDSETACSAVEHGDLEIAIITMPTAPLANLLLSPVWDDPLLVVIGRNHPLATEKKTNAIPPRFLAEEPAILTGKTTYTREIIDKEFAKHGINLTVKLSTNYLETIKMLVTIGLGWSILPATMAADSDLITLKVKGINPSRTLGVVRHANRTLSNAAREMITMLKQYETKAN